MTPALALCLGSLASAAYAQAPSLGAAFAALQDEGRKTAPKLEAPKVGFSFDEAEKRYSKLDADLPDGKAEGEWLLVGDASFGRRDKPGRWDPEGLANRQDGGEPDVALGSAKFFRAEKALEKGQGALRVEAHALVDLSGRSRSKPQTVEAFRNSPCELQFTFETSIHLYYQELYDEGYEHRCRLAHDDLLLCAVAFRLPDGRPRDRMGKGGEFSDYRALNGRVLWYHALKRVPNGYVADEEARVTKARETRILAFLDQARRLQTELTAELGRSYRNGITKALFLKSEGREAKARFEERCAAFEKALRGASEELRGARRDSGHHGALRELAEWGRGVLVVEEVEEDHHVFRRILDTYDFRY